MEQIPKRMRASQASLRQQTYLHSILQVFRKSRASRQQPISKSFSLQAFRRNWQKRRCAEPGAWIRISVISWVQPDYAWDYHADTPGFRSLELTEEIRREVLRMINHAADDLPVPSSDDTDHLPTLPNEAQSGTPPLSHEISAQMPATTPSKLAAPSHDTSAAPEPRRSKSIRSAPTRSHGGAFAD